MNDLSLFDRTVSVACKGDITMERGVKNPLNNKKLVKQDTVALEYNTKQKRYYIIIHHLFIKSLSII